MKRLVGVICLFLLTPGYYLFSQAQEPNFRMATWGMTQKEVLQSEGQKIFGEQKTNDGRDLIAFKGKARGLDCVYVYYFADNKLVEGRYLFLTNHTNKNLYIKDFWNVKTELIGKYGQPAEEDMIWNDDLYKSAYNKWGMAVAVGHLVFQATWFPEGMEILLQLSGDNYKFEHVVCYRSTSPEHIELVKKAAEQAKKGIW